MAVTAIFIWGLYIAQVVWGRKSSGTVPVGDLRSADVFQKLKQFADIAYRFCLQERSKYGKIHLHNSWPV